MIYLGSSDGYPESIEWSYGYLTDLKDLGKYLNKYLKEEHIDFFSLDNYKINEIGKYEIRVDYRFLDVTQTIQEDLMILIKIKEWK